MTARPATTRTGGVLVLALAALALAACGSGAPPAPVAPGAAAGAVDVVASTDVYGSIVTAVGGDKVAVTSIIDNPASDPHEYESTPRDAVAVGKAKLVVYNGADYDPFAEKLLASSDQKPTTIDVADLSGLQAQTPAGQEFNEHVWYNLATVSRLAVAVADDLATADPADAATFHTNATSFNQKIDGQRQKVAAIKAAHGGARVAITEPVPLYLLQEAGLVNATPEKFSEAVEEGSDAPAALVAQTLALFGGPDKVSALVLNAQTEDAATKQVMAAATAGGVPIVQVSETLPAGVADYVTWMGGQIDALSTALGSGA